MRSTGAAVGERTSKHQREESHAADLVRRSDHSERAVAVAVVRQAPHFEQGHLVRLLVDACAQSRAASQSSAQPKLYSYQSYEYSYA